MFYGLEYTSKECVFCFCRMDCSLNVNQAELVMFKSFICSLIFYPLVPSITEGGVLKSRTITAGLSTSHCSILLVFTPCYSEAFSVGAPVFGGHVFLPIDWFMIKKWLLSLAVALLWNTNLLYLDLWSVFFILLTYLYFYIWSRLLVGIIWLGPTFFFYPIC